MNCGAARERCFGPAVLRVAETIAYCRVPIAWLHRHRRRHRLAARCAGGAAARGDRPVPRGRAISAATAASHRQCELCRRHAGRCASDLRCRCLHRGDRASHASDAARVWWHSLPRCRGRDRFICSTPGSRISWNARIPATSIRTAAGTSCPIRWPVRRAIFEPAGFKVIELPGRAWAFLAEFGSQWPGDAEALITRLWHPVPENVSMLRSARFGELIRAAALDTARAYLPRHAPAVVAPEEGYLRRTMRATMNWISEATMSVHDHSRWGPTDQIGAGNLLTVEKRLAALQSVREGRVYDVSHEIGAGAPFMAPNQTPFLLSIWASWRDSIKRRRALGATNDAGANVERIEMTAHVGTHIDALGHFSKGDRLYNGLSAADTVTDWGLERLGIEHAPPMITRGVLLDVAGCDGGQHLNPGRVVTPDELARAEEAGEAWRSSLATSR